MKDEIKEILDKLKNGFCSALTYEKLLDYITNLQEERKTLYRYTPGKGFELVGDEDE